MKSLQQSDICGFIFRDLIQNGGIAELYTRVKLHTFRFIFALFLLLST